MKKGWKIFWGICVSLIAIGVICCIVGVALGGSLFGNISKDWSTNQKIFEETKADSSETQGEEQQTFYRIKELEVDISDVNVQIDEYDGRYLAVETFDIPQTVLDEISYTTDESTLKIELKDSKKMKRLLSGNTKAMIRIKVPYHSLQEAEVSVGAGSLYIGQLQAKELQVEIGAGQAKVNQFTADCAEFHCGAGEMQMTGDAQKVNIECGIGSIIYQAKGAQEDYDYQIGSSLGEVTVGDRSFDGIGSGATISKDGAEKELYVDCGIGQVQVEFQNK